MRVFLSQVKVISALCFRRMNIRQAPLFHPRSDYATCWQPSRRTRPFALRRVDLRWP